MYGCFSESGEINMASNETRKGTRRYMAPEMLDETMNSSYFESYRQADMYAFALLLWEISRRCEFDGRLIPAAIHSFIHSFLACTTMKKFIRHVGNMIQ